MEHIQSLVSDDRTTQLDISLTTQRDSLTILIGDANSRNYGEGIDFQKSDVEKLIKILSEFHSEMIETDETE